MSNSELTAFRRLLEAKLEELVSISADRDGIAIEATADEMDRLQQQMSRDLAIHSLDHSSKLLKSVRAALDRTEDGVYGLCLRCEEPIAEKRLKAIPWASYCVVCQEFADQQLASGDDDAAIKFAA